MLHFLQKDVKLTPEEQEELDSLCLQTLLANLLLSTQGLVKLTWGNVSGITKNRRFMVIKPSGITYEDMGKNDMVVVEVSTEKVVSTNQLKPSTDAPTHLLLYKTFPSLKGITHTHSTFATSWAQASQDIPCLGTTHADNALGAIPCTRPMTSSETESDYELNTGKVIIETLTKRGLSVESMPAILVSEHGVFCWSTTSVHHSVEVAVSLEEIAKMAVFTRFIAPNKTTINPPLQNKHFQRKHGKNAYYGQKPQTSPTSTAKRR